MTTYALMKNPNHTRVSFQDSDTLAIKELTAMSSLISAKNIRLKEIGGIQYVLFDSDQALVEHALCVTSRLSFVYAIFEMSGEMLMPITPMPNYFLGSDLSTILKYTGKTNELFTRFMLNIAQTYIKTPVENLNILDPLAGKGTTLYEALMQGYNAYGVEIDAKLAHESVVYLKKYLETAKYKHANHTERVSGQLSHGKFTATRSQIKFTESGRQFEIVEGDTRNTSAYFKKNFFHGIIADMPYGVQHGSKSSKKPQGATITRNALGLITEAMPGWVKVLKPGGVIVLAWNLFLISKAEMVELLEGHGFAVPELDFAHRVDQAIDREFIVGVK